MHSINKALVASALLCAASAVNVINVQGQDFVDSVNGQRFEILGIDYQPGGSSGFQENADGSGEDPLSNPTACLRDAALMQTLGINAIRVYNIDPYLDHNECASIFNYAGIYMVLDVNSPLPNESINQDDPSSSYDAAYLNRTFAILDNFREFPNTLGFFSANELINADSNTNTAPYIRAVTRDLKQYMQARGGRQVPVGYSAADVRDILGDTSNYVQCTINGTTSADYINGGKSDFFGLNSYSWCGDATFVSSTYNQLAALFANTTIPVFFSEFGCNQVEPRTFTEIAALYGPNMTTWSGGLVYEWTQETNNYGLVNVNSDGSLTILQDYANLQGQYNALNLTRLESANASANALTPPICAADLISNGSFPTSFALPTQPPGVAALISSGAPGASVGSTVSVTSTALAINVTPLSGAVTSTLSITQAKSANVPGGATGSAAVTASATGSAASASATKKSAATTNRGNAMFGVGIAALAMWLLV